MATSKAGGSGKAGAGQAEDGATGATPKKARGTGGGAARKGATAKKTGGAGLASGTDASDAPASATATAGGATAKGGAARKQPAKQAAAVADGESVPVAPETAGGDPGTGMGAAKTRQTGAAAAKKAVGGGAASKTATKAAGGAAAKKGGGAAAKKSGGARTRGGVTADGGAGTAAAAADGQGDLRDHYRRFVGAHPDGWNHEQWLGLVDELRAHGHDVSDTDTIGAGLERERLVMTLEGAGVGGKRASTLVETFGTLYSLVQAGADQVVAAAKVPRNLAEKLFQSLR